MVTVIYGCRVCGCDFNSREEAEDCERIHKELRAKKIAEGPPLCEFCDMPAELEDDEGWLEWRADCECGQDHWHDDTRFRALDGDYERTARLRDVEVLPWEYAPERRK